MTAPADFSVPTKVFPLITLFPSFFSLLLSIMAIMAFTQKVSKNEYFFTFYDSFLLFKSILLKTFCLGNNLSMHIKENTDFLRQKPRQLPSAEANSKGCTDCNY